VTQAPARVLATVAEIALTDYSKGADGGGHPAFRAVDLVDAIAFSDGTTLASARQIEVPGKHVARIAIAGMTAVAGSATAAAAPVETVAAVAVISRSRIVSVRHCWSSRLSACPAIEGSQGEHFEYAQARDEPAIRIRDA